MLIDNELNDPLEAFGEGKKDRDRPVAMRIKRVRIFFWDASYTSTLPIIGKIAVQEEWLIIEDRRVEMSVAHFLGFCQDLPIFCFSIPRSTL